MIQTEFGTFDGDKWEQICKICFYRMYEEQDEVYFHIEATPGDDGLEGFTNKGKAFQCYCPDNNYTADELHKHLTVKINNDLNKLKDRHDALKKHLGDVKIKTWYFVTPDIRKNEIIAYCNKKTNDVRNWKLSIIDNDNFVVNPVNIDFIRPYLATALGSINQKLAFRPTNKTNISEIANYEGSDQGYLVVNAKTKHTKQLDQGGADIAHADHLTHKTIEYYLEGKKVLALWQNQTPKDFEKFEQIISQEEDDIQLSSMFPNGNHQQRYLEVKNKVEEKLISNFQNLHYTTIKDLSNYVIADWILRCPLNFV